MGADEKEANEEEKKETKPPLIVDDVCLTTVPLTLYKDECRIGTATGFFYQKEEDYFLVSNRHVIIDEKKEYYPNKIKFRVHTNCANTLENKNVVIDIYNAENKPLWLEAKIRPADVDGKKKPIDIAIVPIKRESDWVIKSFSKINLLPENNHIPLGASLLVVGYPRGFYDIYNNFPIVRKANLASVHRLRFLKRFCFLVDAKLHPGTSGSPVVTQPASTLMVEKGKISYPSLTSYFLLGINSGEHADLQLNAIWYASLIEDIINRKI